MPHQIDWNIIPAAKYGGQDLAQKLQAIIDWIEDRTGLDPDKIRPLRCPTEAEWRRDRKLPPLEGFAIRGRRKAGQSWDQLIAELFEEAKQAMLTSLASG